MNWNLNEIQELKKQWSNYFTVLESVTEGEAHLLDTVLPKISQLLDPSSKIDVHWIQSILHCGFQSRSQASRKKFLVYTMENTNTHILDHLVAHNQFLFEVFIPFLDQIYLYGSSGVEISCISTFGDQVVGFIKQILTYAKECRIEQAIEKSAITMLVTRFVQCIESFSNPLAPLFVLQAISEFDCDSKTLFYEGTNAF